MYKGKAYSHSYIKDNSESFPKLITECGKAKRHSVGKMVKNDFWGILEYFWCFRRKFPRETEMGASG